MADATQTVLTVGIPTIAVLVGILLNNSRLGDLRGHMDERLNDVNRRIDDARDLLRSEFVRVENR
jgi:hypothetical protein